MFTTIESLDLGSSLMVRPKNHDPDLPFSRDVLFVSILDCLRHRPTSLSDATELTATTIRKLTTLRKALLESKTIAQTAYEIVNRFDNLAGALYARYHLRD